MPFKKGQSGNPKGRTKSISTPNQLRKRLSFDMPEIINSMVELAKSGDMTAAKLLLDRTYPAVKPQALPAIVPQGATLTETSQNILDGTLQGKISPDTGTQLLAALSESAKLNELSQINERLAAIEAKLTK